VLALGFLLTHLRALPQTLEDIDSINFAMGVESFDVASHQPHPPGYPVFVMMAKASTSAIRLAAPGWDRDARAAAGLAIWNIIAGALAALVLFEFWIAIGFTPALAALSSLLTVTSPLFWFTASRPLTDTVGLVAAIAAQVWILRGFRAFRADASVLPRDWIWGAAAAGLIIGLRSQTLWLTAPLLVWAVLLLAARARWRDAGTIVAASAIGSIVWAIPLVWSTGGAGAYLSALGSQGSQDFSGIEMLATVPSWRLFTRSLGLTFAAPWQAAALANVVLVLALVGLVRLTRRDRSAVALLIVGFVPYLVFHLLFHEVVTIRYALPILVPVAGLAVFGLAILGVRVAIVGAAAAAIASLLVVHPRLEAYAAGGAPVFRALQQMQRELPAPPERPLLRMHHQVWWGTRRATDWYRGSWDVGPQPGPGTPEFAREWLGLVRHWAEGDPRPAWLLVDLTRTDVALFDRRSRSLGGRYEFPADLRQLVQVGARRLDSLGWWKINRPGWMLGRGWSVTPEVAGMTNADAVTPDRQPAEGFIYRRSGPMRMLIGGRLLRGETNAVVTATLDGQPLAEWTVVRDPNWFVQWIDLPNGVPAGSNPYASLGVSVRSAVAGAPAPLVGLEQFDVAPVGDVLYAFTDGWWEPEEDPRRGVSWRWSSDRSTLFVQEPSSDLRMTLSGESPLKNFDRAPVVIVRAGDVELGRFSPSADFTQTIDVPRGAIVAAGGRITIETDLSFVPRERGASPDPRRLGLRFYRVEIDRRQQ
jgi:hypothetical protein